MPPEARGDKLKGTYTSRSLGTRDKAVACRALAKVYGQMQSMFEAEAVSPATKLGKPTQTLPTAKLLAGWTRSAERNSAQGACVRVASHNETVIAGITGTISHSPPPTPRKPFETIELGYGQQELLGDRHAVVADGRRPPALLSGYGLRFRPERDADVVGEQRCAGEDLLTGR